MSGYLKPSSVIAAFVLVSSSCVTWKTDSRPVPVVVERHANDKVAITMNDLRWVALRRPTIQGDSIIGTRIAGNTYGRGRTALSLEGVRAIQTRRFSIVRTTLLGAAAFFGVPAFYKLAFVEED